ncbi:MAG TPA: hypothetical protein VFV39_02270 [Limnobacter sp.]|nr:hypothetical protein [Limnobacter sp.]
MATPQALITALEGEVTVVRNGEKLPVKPGDFLLPGDQVQTGNTGRLALEFAGQQGQSPAAGIMTANGKITLGEQAGNHGQQMVVLEDVECFEFTTDVAENSAAIEGGNVAGLFGAGMLGAGGASLAGVGAVAAGAFLAGGSDSGGADSPALGSSGGGGNGGGNFGPGEFSSADSPQSLEEFANENLTQDNLQSSVIDPVAQAIENSAENPQSTPDNLGTAAGDLGLAGAENIHDLLVATTGEGSAQATVVDQLVQGLEATPLGEPLSPLTTPLQEAVNTDLGLDTLISALQGAGLEANNLIDGGGLVGSVVNLADTTATPLTAQIEPLDMAIDQLHPVAAELDGVIDDVLDGLDSALNASPLGSEVPNGEQSLADLAEGILGGADTLQNALSNAGSSGPGLDLPEGDLLGTVSSGIASGADALADKLGGAGGLPTELPSV